MTPSSSQSSERTPLLQQEQQLDQGSQQSPESPEGHDLDFTFPAEGYIFTEVIQSPFDFISNEMGFIIRLVLAVSMTTILGAYFFLEYRAGNARIFSFRLMNVVWTTQCFYMWLVSIWSYISISAGSTLPYFPYRPHIHFSFRTCILSILTHSRVFNILFRSLYTIVTTLPFPSALFYLFILLPNTSTPSYPAVLPEFIIAVASTIIAFFEIFVLNSIIPVPGRRCSHHIEQVIFLTLYMLAYAALWVRLGNVMSGVPVDAELDWRLLGGFGNDRGGIVTEIIVSVVIYFYGVVEFLHCCKYYCFG